MKRIQQILGMDDDTFADAMAGAVGFVTGVLGVFVLHMMGYIG